MMLTAQEMLRKLDINRLVLQIHDPALPSTEDEDAGRGSPYSNGAADFFRFLEKLGFNGLQFGPQGQTPRSTPCPYDGRLFPHDFRSIALRPLAEDEYWRGILNPETVQRVVENRPSGHHRTHHAYAWDEISAAVDEAFACFRARGNEDAPVDRDFEEFCEASRSWLDKDHTGNIARRAAFDQFILDRQRRRMRDRFPELRCYGDLQIGMASDDALEFASLFHPDYLMGAPPSRTNPEGQPWGYSVFHPEKVRNGEAQQFLRRRVARMLSGFDGIRIDHPHGLVCPWVYRRDVKPPHKAVRAGARLYGSPDNEEHPQLAEDAIPGKDQINRSAAPHSDEWVRDLTEEQVRQYSALMEVILECVREEGGDLISDVACEVLSTQPYPLKCVMEYHGLGRFRVIQKAKLDQPDDVYRIEQARPHDWIMMGNHDTPPIWLLARGWCDSARAQEWAEYLAERLMVPESRRSAFVKRTSAEPGELIHALFAAILASDAQHVSMFFTDLLGMTAFYNSPGVINDTNWTLRVPPDFASVYERKCRKGEALDIVKCVQLALEASERSAADQS